MNKRHEYLDIIHLNCWSINGDESDRCSYEQCLCSSKNKAWKKKKKKGKERAGEKIEVISRYKETPLSKAFSHWIEYSSYFFQK